MNKNCENVKELKIFGKCFFFFVLYFSLKMKSDYCCYLIWKMSVINCEKTDHKHVSLGECNEMRSTFTEELSMWAYLCHNNIIVLSLSKLYCDFLSYLADLQFTNFGLLYRSIDSRQYQLFKQWDSSQNKRFSLWFQVNVILRNFLLIKDSMTSLS